MSEVASATAGVNHEKPEGVLNGGLEKQPATHVEGEEESDDYDEEEEADYEEDKQIAGDEDDDQEEEEEEEEEGEEDNQGKDGLTHLLLGNPNAPVEGDDIDDEEDEDEEDEDEYLEAADDVAPTSGKKRSIDEVADEDDSQGSKKAKA